MAALAEHPTVVPSTSPMPGVNGVYENDMDAYLNLDQFTYTDASRSKAAMPSQPSVASSEFSTDMRSASFASTSQSPMAFPAPSHQYDEHTQQTGLPPGGVAHAMTFNNHVNGMNFGAGNQGFPMNGDMFNQMKREDAPIDFNSAPIRNPSDMDMESDNMPYYFSPNSNKSQFVDPNALGGRDGVPMGPSTQVGRMYPGMHQQQAAMAKAAQQQKHKDYLRQQQMQQRRMEEHVPQTSTPQPQASRISNPVVEERISRLLQQMRQNAMNSPDGSPSPSILPQMAKAKKEEQDMDEDERLLASEEGKKLSSKERRQLRNKVSARAFRSRRKEYIGQLESEVAARTNEAHDLRLQNRALYEENNRLTDLARMLLSSSHFSSFLDEMNVSGLPAAAQPQQQHPQQQQQPQPQQHQQAIQQPHMQANIPKEQPHAHQEFQMPQAPQAGMGMVPNQGMGVPAMGFDNAGWNSGIDVNYGNTPVFAVMEVPQGPVLDVEALSGKSSSFGSYVPETSKNEVPTLERPPVVETSEESEVEVSDVEIDESDPAFALFIDTPATSPSNESGERFDGITSEKSPAFELVLQNESQNKVNRLACLCDSMEAAFDRVSMVTSHLL